MVLPTPQGAQPRLPPANTREGSGSETSVNPTSLTFWPGKGESPPGCSVHASRPGTPEERSKGAFLQSARAQRRQRRRGSPAASYGERIRRRPSGALHTGTPFDLSPNRWRRALRGGGSNRASVTVLQATTIGKRNHFNPDPRRFAGRKTRPKPREELRPRLGLLFAPSGRRERGGGGGHFCHFNFPLPRLPGRPLPRFGAGATAPWTRPRRQQPHHEREHASARTMSHALLRNIFRILLLYLVLVPDAPSLCMKAIQEEYENVLFPFITYLNNLIQDTPSCNSTKENSTGQITASYRCCCRSNKERALRCMAKYLKKMSKTSCISTKEEIKQRMEYVSTVTLMLQEKYTNTTASTAQKRESCRCTDCCCKMLDPICCTKKVIFDLMSCWRHFIL
nr:uncharacterized protein LOC110075890 [Pogona vitticeps]